MFFIKNTDQKLAWKYNWEKYVDSCIDQHITWKWNLQQVSILSQNEEPLLDVSSLEQLGSSDVGILETDIKLNLIAEHELKVLPWDEA